LFIFHIYFPLFSLYFLFLSQVPAQSLLFFFLPDEIDKVHSNRYGGGGDIFQDINP
jgi:hypothetical protein